MSSSLLLVTILLVLVCGTRAVIAAATKENVFFWAIAPVVWCAIVLVGCVAR